MVTENSNADRNRCFCLFDCECDKLDRLILDWTSADALKIVRSRLFVYTDPTEIFARLACVLFYREILNGTPISSMKDNLRKADIALRVASAFASDLNGCSEFHSSCWKKFHELSGLLETSLSHFSIATRRTIRLRTLIEEVLPPLENSYTDPSSEAGITDEAGADSVVISEVIAASSAESVDSETEIVQLKAPEALESIKNELTDSGNESTIGDIADGTISNPSEDDSANRIVVDDDEKLKTQPRPGSDAPSSDDEPQWQEASPPARGSGDSYENTSSEDSYEGSSCDDVDSDDGTVKDASVSEVVAQNIELKSCEKTRNEWHKCDKTGCERQFKFKWLLTRHYRVHHYHLGCFFVCDECGEDFADLHDYCVHGMVHLESRPVVCRHCDFRYPTEEARRYHEIKAHWNETLPSSSSSQSS